MLWVFSYNGTMLTELQRVLKLQGTVTFSVRVHPGVSKTKVKGIMADGTIKMDIAAVPEDGKANAELTRFLGEEFKVPRSHVEVVKGQMARTKMVRVRGMRD